MSKYSFKKYQPLSLRLWHWLNAMVILGLLTTVLLRKTFLSWRTNSVLIQDKLTEVGTSITPELAKDIAVAIRNPLWDWHIYLGYFLAALILSRVLIAIFIEKKCIVLKPLKNLFQFGQVPQTEKTEFLHYSLVKIGYGIFYLATLLMVISGFMLTFKTELNLAKELSQNIKETHELMMWFFVVFVLGHLLGVVIAENKKDAGIISDMINGGNKEDETTQ